MLESIISFAYEYTYPGLFVAALFSYFILPIPPIEALIVLATKTHNPFMIFLVTMAGSTVGSILNYFVGLKGIRWALKKYKKTESKSRKIFDKWGPMSIVLFGWMPVIGNPLVIIAGTLRMNFTKFMIYSTAGKIWFFSLVIWLGVTFTSMI